MQDDSVGDLRPEPLGPLPEAPATSQPLGRVFRHGLQYALGGLAYKAVALLSVPILARILTPAELGALDLAVLVAIVVSIIGTVGLDTALARLDAEALLTRSLWGTALLIMAIGLVATTALVAVLSPWLASVLLADSEHAGVVAAGGIYGCSLAVTTIGLNSIRLRELPLRYAAYGFAIVVGEMLAALTLAALGLAVPVIVLGWAGASAIGGLVLYSREMPMIGSPSWDIARRLLTFGLPLLPGALSWIVGDLAIRGIVSDRLGLDALGQYGIAARITSVLALLVTGFGLAWHPFLYRARVDQTGPLAKRAALRLALSTGAVTVLLAALAPEAVALAAGVGYEGASPLVGPMGIGMIGFGLVILGTAVLGVHYRTRDVALATVSGAFAQIVLAALLVGPLGIAGTGIGIAGGYAVAFAVIASRGPLVSVRLLLAATTIVLSVAVVGWLIDESVLLRLGVAVASLIALVTFWPRSSSRETPPK